MVTGGSEEPIGILIHGGRGRMGRAVAAAAEAHGVVVRGVIDFRRNGQKPVEERPFFDHISDVEGRVDAVVDFSRPTGIGPLVTGLAGTRIGLVSGTTGLSTQEQALLEGYSEEAAVFYDENMSYGMFIMKTLVRVAAPLWRGEADVEIVETHRRGKRDYPSGTAYALARAVDGEARLVSGRGEGRTAAERVIRGHSLRLGGVVGDHHVHFATEDEVLTVSHRALSRDVFAQGALRAVRFIVGKAPGTYSMDDLAGI